jgi:hypothetical protein
MEKEKESGRRGGHGVLLHPSRARSQWHEHLPAGTTSWRLHHLQIAPPWRSKPLPNELFVKVHFIAQMFTQYYKELARRWICNHSPQEVVSWGKTQTETFLKMRDRLRYGLGGKPEWEVSPEETIC